MIPQSLLIEVVVAKVVIKTIKGMYSNSYVVGDVANVEKVQLGCLVAVTA